MNLQFVDKNNKPLKAGDYISFDGSKPELLYECDMGYNVGIGLGVNASRHYVGSELYPLTEFPYELTPEGKIRMLTGEKFLIAVKRSQKPMKLTLKDAKKYLKAYKRAYKMILKMYRWCIIPLKNPLEEKSYIEEQLASYTELVKRLKKKARKSK